ncbi:MAG TPA: HEAT repeat domain-containing protein [Candidatus Nanoarchaeia archaeon]|nr:HEAT repeat domain-containing protein [Candidatus Nanoarchaeia archaeon]
MTQNYKHTILNLKARKEDRIQAAFQLENNADDAAVDALGKALLTDPSPIVRHECAFSLGETGYPDKASSYLLQAIQTDKNIFVVHEALLALATLGDAKFIPFIKQYLKDPRPEIAESAEIALERLQ